MPDRAKKRRVRSGVLCLLAFTAAAVAGAAYYLGSTRVSPNGRHIPETRAELVSLLGGLRPIEGRLVGLDYAPLGSTESVKLARELLRKSVKKEPTLEELANIALLRLAAGQLDSAVSLLEEVTSKPGAPAYLWADLSGVYLEKGRRKGSRHFLARALDAADRALRHDPSLEEARFNFALASTRLGLKATALTLWQRYRALDPDSGWAREAQRHLEVLAQRNEREVWLQQRAEVEAGDIDLRSASFHEMIARHPQQWREYAEEAVLGKWAIAQRQGQLQEAERLLEMVRSIGLALSATGGDQMLRKAVEAIDKSLDRTLKLQGNRYLVEGHGRYQEGIEFYQSWNFAQAAVRLREARDLLMAGGSPFAEWASYQLARCDYQHHRYEEVLESISSLLLSTEDAGFRPLRGRALWLMGLVAVILGDPAASLEHYKGALEEFTVAGELAHVGRMHALTAGTLGYLGEPQEAWEHLAVALDAAQKTGDETLCQVAFDTASASVLKLGLPGVAARFQDEIVPAVVRKGDPGPAWYALLRRALLSGHDMKRAFRDLSQARRFALRVEDPVAKSSMLSDVLFAEGRLWRETSPEKAISLFSEALEHYEATSYHYRKAQILFERALARLATGDESGGEEDLLASVLEQERQREYIQEDHYKMTYLAQAQAVFDELVALHERRNRPDLALNYVEQQRARVLLDWLLTLPTGKVAVEGSELGLARPLRSEDILARVPKDTAIVVYAAIKGKLGAWVLSQGQLGYTPLGLRVESVRELASVFQKSLSRAEAGEQYAAGTSLYEAVIRPLESALGGVRRLVLVPDESLWMIPFAGLFDEQRGTYLAETYTLTIAPSATVYVYGVDRDKELGQGFQSALLVGDPAFDRDLFPKLGRLSESLQEVEAIASQYSDHRKLTDSQATKAEFLGFAGRYQVVHFGGHTIVNREAPLLGHLALAPDISGRDRGVLYGWEILSHRFDRTRLVLLAACRSSQGGFAPAEGAVNLAWPFLARGVPAVLVSAWDVPDYTPFFFRFHQELRAVQDPAVALQSTQLAFIRGEDSRYSTPRFWAGFLLLGSSRAND